MGRKIGWWVVVALGWLVAAYGLATAFLGDRVYPSELADSFRARPWGIFTHALFGSIAMILGPWQFRRGLRWNRALHRWLGRVYLGGCLLTGGAGLYLAPYSDGGMMTHLGFGSLAVILLGVSATAYRAIRNRQVARHREWMIRSYALIFAGVTLRIELPLLIAVLGQFQSAYLIVAWLCWVPNLLAAEWYLWRSRPTSVATLPRVLGEAA